MYAALHKACQGFRPKVQPGVHRLAAKLHVTDVLQRLRQLSVGPGPLLVRPHLTFTVGPGFAKFAVHSLAFADVQRLYHRAALAYPCLEL